MRWKCTKIESTGQGFGSIAKLTEVSKERFAETITLDFSGCTFFDANMVAPLGAVLAMLADNLNKVEIIKIPEAIERILRKNRFLVSFGYPPLTDSNQTTLPFRRMRITDEGRFADYLERYLSGKGIPKMTRGLRKVFRQSIFEVFHNSVIHSDSRLGVFVCGQYYPKKKRMDLTIADAGVGIRNTVRQHFKKDDISSVAAIRWALQEGHTTKTGQSPGGIGLKLLKDFISKNKGRIQIASRWGFYEFHNGQEVFTKQAADLPGTTVNLEVNTADKSNYCLRSEISSNDIF